MTHRIVKTIDVHALKQSLANDPTLCLIDVREPDEWAEQRIPGARLIPKDTLTDVISSVAPNKNHPIYLHCKGGIRSFWAGERLLEMGYTDVYSVNGGIMDWAQSGYPVERN